MTLPKFLIDTDIFIDYFNGFSSAIKLLNEIKDKKARGYFSILTEGELLAGCRNREEQEKVDALLIKFERIDLSVSIIRKAAEYRRIYQKNGLGLIDAIIAASAYHSETKLCTRNIKHFKPIKELHLLSL